MSVDTVPSENRILKHPAAGAPLREPAVADTPKLGVSRLIIGALLVAGVVLTLLVFWPGAMTYDATFVYGSIGERPGDWQSPVMSLLWGLIDPIAPGSGSMFLLMTALYWLSFGILAFTLARRSPVLAVVLLLLALSPPAFLLVGVIWRDILLADAWLLALALAFATADRPARIAYPARALAVALIAFGLLLRTNALFAVPILVGYVLWPKTFAWKRIALCYLPVAAAGYLLVQFVFYGLVDAQRQNLLHTILVFDLGGITHFTQQNWFPVTFSENEMRLLKGVCYDPSQWDTYWRLDPCSFVMRRLEENEIFGYPAMVEAWKHAVLSNPLPYLQHRFAHFFTFLGQAHSTVAFHALEDPERPMFPNHVLFNALAQMDAAINQTIFFRLGLWLAACFAVFLLAWRFRESRTGAFALAISLSSIFYMMTFLPVGVASAYRYGFWAVLASYAGGVFLISAWRTAAAVRPAAGWQAARAAAADGSIG